MLEIRHVFGAGISELLKRKPYRILFCYGQAPNEDFEVVEMANS